MTMYRISNYSSDKRLEWLDEVWFNHTLEQWDTTVVKRIKEALSWALVAHAYNPSSLGGWDWEDHDRRPA
jgi:hypothetical protein